MIRGVEGLRSEASAFIGEREYQRVSLLRTYELGAEGDEAVGTERGEDWRVGM
jgi:hypothetical protein